jgi:hypothetical protein
MAYAISEHMRNRLNAAGSNSLAAYSNAREEKKEKKNKGGLLSGLGYVGGQLLSGIFGVGEGVYDFVVGGVADLFGAEEFSERLIKDDVTGDWQRGLNDWYNPSKGMQFVGDVASGLGQTATYVGLNLIPGAGTALSTGAMVAGAGGRGVTAAYQKTGKLGNKEWLYGAGSGLVEAGLEKATGGVGKITKSITKSAGKEVTQSVAKSAVRSGIFKTALKTGGGEFLEEAASEIINPYLERWTGVDKNAENASLGEILRAGAVGFVSGAIGSVGGSGIGNARSLSAGSKISKGETAEFKIGNRTVATNNKDAILSEANDLMSMVDNQDVGESVSANLMQLKGSLDAYNNLSNKDGVRGKMLLGEIARGVAYTNVSNGFEATKQEIMDSAEDIAEYLTQAKGQTYTAEDIRANKDGVTDQLAIASFSSQMIGNPEVANELIQQGKVGVLRMASQYEAWKNNLSDEQLAKASADLGIDLSTATHKQFMKAMQGFNQRRAQEQSQQAELQAQANAQSQVQAQQTQAVTDWQNTISNANLEGTTNGAVRKQLTPLPQTVSLKDGEGAVYRAENGLVVGVKKDAEGYLVAFDSADGQGLGKFAKHITEEQLGDVITQIRNFKETTPTVESTENLQSQRKNISEQQETESTATTEATQETQETQETESTVKKVMRNARERALTNKARNLVKDFDMLSGNTKANIREMIASSENFSNLSEEDLSFVANLMSKSGDVRVTFADLGKESNGVWTKEFDGLRYVQLNAANPQTSIKRAAIHELAHDMYNTKNAAFKELSQAAVELLSEEKVNDIKERYRKYYEEQGKSDELTDDLVQDELSAYALENVLNNKSFIRKHLNAKTEGFISSLKDKAYRTALWFKGKFSPVQRFYNALGKAYDTILEAPKAEQINTKTINTESISSGNLDKNSVLTEQDFAESKETHSKTKQIADKMNGDTRYSIVYATDIANNQEDWYEKHAKNISKEELSSGIKKAREMVDIMSKYSPILPEDKIGKTLVSNGSYDKSVENTTICVRTLAYNQFIDAVQERLGRPLSQMESFLVSQKLYDIATEPQCLYCYVSLDRKAYNDFLLRYIKDRDAIIEKYNNSAKTQEDKNALYLEFLNGRKDTPNMRKRWSMWMNIADNGGRFITAQDVATDERRLESSKNKDLKLQFDDITKYAQSASWAKKQQNYVAYRDDILKLSDKVIKDLNQHYGLRWYSFSDYSGAFIVENMQQITDASLRGLKGLAYTKDTDFAKIFAPTGMNINISVYAKKINGEYQIDAAQSANIDEAIALRKKYPNVGIVVTATDTDGVNWALNQEWSDVVIPFHIVRSGQDVANFYNWELFNDSQSDTIDNQDLWQAYLDRIGKKKASKNIYPNEHKNDFETYKRLCEERGLKPRFSQFIENPNYMKLVNETRQTDDQTSALKPNFDLGAAKQSFNKFVDKGGYYGGWYKDGISLDAEVETVAQDIIEGKKANEVEYGRQDIDLESLAKSRKTVRKHASPTDTERLSLSQGEESAIYVLDGKNKNGKDVNFIDLILDGKKLGETREHKNLVKNKWVGLAKNGYVYGRVILGNPKEITKTSAEYKDAYIGGTNYDIVEEGKKYYYPILEKQDFRNNPIPLLREGNYGVYALPQDTEMMSLSKNEDAARGLVEKNKKVKERASLGSIVDSEGNKLTEEQRKFFKDSKIRDKDGNLLVCTHNSRFKFTVFDKSKFGEENGYSFGKGFYFFAGKYKSSGNTYGKEQYTVYLNIRNPYNYFSMDKKYIIDMLENSGYEYDKDFVESYDEERLWDGDLIDDFLYKALMGKNPYNEFSKMLQNAGFDGIWVDGEMIAFEPNQIKLTTNKNPTESEDIRFSLTYAPTGKTNIVMDNTLSRAERREAQKAAKKYTHRFQSLRVAFVNQQAAIEDALKDMGKSLEEYEAIVQTARSASSKAQRAIGGDIVDTSEMHTSGDATTLAKGIQKVMAPVKKAKLEAEFFDYLFNRHNIDRLKVDKPVNGNTAEESQAVIKRLEKQHPEMKKWGEEWDKMVGALLTLRVKEGIITQEQADYLRETYPHYVPTYREGGAKQGMTGGFKGKNDVMISKTLKRATGSTEALLRPDEVIARQIMETYRAIGGNYVANQLYESYLASGKNHPDIEIVSKEKVTKEDAENTDVIGNLEEGSQAAVNKTNGTVTFYRDGERITMRVSSKILAGFDGFYKTSSVYEQNIAARTLAKGMQLFKSAVTNWNPFFLIRNAVRDIQDAAIYTKNGKNFALQIPNAWKGILSNSKEWQLYLSAGGMNSNVFGSEGFTGMVSERGFETIDVSSEQGLKQAWSFMKKQGMKLEAINMVVEQIPRFAEFLASRKAGKTVDQALLDSADVTVNFGRSGSVTRIANRYFIPFINASVQGASKIFRTAFGRKTGAAWCSLAIRCAVLGIVPAILNNAMYDDDEDYQKLRTDVKENYFLFKIGEGKFIKLPKGRINALISGANVRTQMAIKGEEDAFEGYGESILNTLTPVESASRTIFSPFTDVKTNTTWYGTAIEGREFENKAIKDRYDETTSSIAIWLGKSKLMQDLGYSPKKIHYLIDQYTGVIGDVLLPATNKVAEKGLFDANLTVDAVTSNKLSSKFYKIYDETTYKKSAGDENAALELRYLNKVKEAVSDLYKEKDKVNASNKTEKEKLAENRIIQTLINQTYQNALYEKGILSNAFAATKGIGSEYEVVEVTKKNYKKLEEKQDNIGAYVITRNGLTTGKLYESQEKATKGLSDMIADYRYTEGIHLMHGAERALKYYNTATYEKAQKLNGAGVSYDDYYFAYMTAKQYAGDSEDKREFTIETIADLDLSREQTLLMIYAFGYSVKDGEFYGMTSKAAKTRMARYIKSLKISTEEKISLAKACGLTVKNGKIVTK